MSATSPSTPVTILIGALGGEGGGVLAQWLVEAAAQAGFPAQATSIPGVAQRTGATTYYVEIVPRPRASLGGREPVLSLYPTPGRVDLVVASELLEAGRIVAQGITSPERTLLIASTSRTLTTAEKVALGDGRFASDRLLAAARKHSRRLVAFDMELAAREAGTAMSAVMFGAIAGSGLLPFGREACEGVIGASGASALASRAGFGAGFAAMAPELVIAPAVAAPAAPLPPRQDAFDDFPAGARDFASLGHARVVAFQDDAYGALYRERLVRVLAAERAGDPDGMHGHTVTRETARYLALWMAFDDVIRVAEAKAAAGRIARIRAETKAAPGDVLKIVDHFKPGLPELAGLLPPRWAGRVLAWDRRRQAAGKAPLEWALKLRSDGVGGLVALRVLGGLKRWRRRGTRYGDEQAAIGAWLAAVERWAREDPACALEVALSGRLVKGYGATNQRGKRNLAHILEHVAGGGAFANAAARARALRAAREAALADEAGTALDRTLAMHGAPVRPVVAQPIRWTPRPKAAPGGAVTKVGP